MNNKDLNTEIKKIKNQLINNYQPKKIVLFGSAVKGKQGRDSDLDFFLIKEDVPFYGTERMREVRSLINYQVPCDFLVAKPEEVEERKELGDPFINSILEEGRVLYGD